MLLLLILPLLLLLPITDGHIHHHDVTMAAAAAAAATVEGRTTLSEGDGEEEGGEERGGIARRGSWSLLFTTGEDILGIMEEEVRIILKKEEGILGTENGSVGGWGCVDLGEEDLGGLGGRWVGLVEVQEGLVDRVGGGST